MPASLFRLLIALPAALLLMIPGPDPAAASTLQTIKERGVLLEAVRTDGAEIRALTAEQSGLDVLYRELVEEGG